jgi:hypothetical protein
MSIVEFIGFLISFIAVIFLFFKNRYEQKAVEYTESEEEKEENLSLQRILTSLQEERETLEIKPQKPPSAPPKVEKKPARLKNYQMTSQIEQRKIKSRLENRQLKPTVKKPEEAELVVIRPPSRGRLLVNQLPRLANLVVYEAILGKPKGWN